MEPPAKARRNLIGTYWNSNSSIKIRTDSKKYL